MKITGVSIFVARNDLQGKLWNPKIRWGVKSSVIVKAHTDTGADGIGGLRIGKPDAPIVSAYAALSAENFEDALKFVKAAADHVLAARLEGVVCAKRAQRAYESAMKRAQESVAGEQWNEAIGACEEALIQKPGDTEATDLLAEARRRKGQVYGKNLLVNGSAELFPFADNGWTQATGTWQRRGDPKPKHGEAIFAAGMSSSAELHQDVSVSPYSDEIKSGTQQFKFEGFVVGWHESMRIVVECRSTKGQVLASCDTGELASQKWKLIEKAVRPPAGTAMLRVRLVARKKKGRTNNSYYDDLRLIALKPDGSSSSQETPGGSSHAAPGQKPEPPEPRH